LADGDIAQSQELGATFNIYSRINLDQGQLEKEEEKRKSTS